MKILVVDDSSVYRRFVREVLSSMPTVEIVGEASNGAIALELCEKLNPHIVILDIHMPVMDGIGVLEELRSRGQGPAVIVLSSDATMAVKQTTRALALGAFDFVLKPTGVEAVATLRLKLSQRIQAIGQARLGRNVHKSSPQSFGSPVDVCTRRRTRAPEIIAIGISTGGPVALATVLPKIPADLPVPILIVQHMPPAFTQELAKHLDDLSSIRVRHAVDNEVIEAGCVYLAPGGQQMKVQESGARRAIGVANSPPINNCCPSVDHLLQSVADVYGDSSLALIMTGMGHDGTDGCRMIKEVNGTVVTQDSESCVVYGMPRSVVDAGLSNESWHLEEIADRLSDIAMKGDGYARTIAK